MDIGIKEGGLPGFFRPEGYTVASLSKVRG